MPPNPCSQILFRWYKSIEELFLEEELLDLINKFSKIKKSRHEIQCRGYFSGLEEAEFAIDLARGFVNKVESILNLVKETKTQLRDLLMDGTDSISVKEARRRFKKRWSKSE